MKSFLKFTLASILGFIVASFICLFILIGIIGSLAQSGDGIPTVKENSVLELKFDYQIADKATPNPFKDIDFATFEPKKKLGLNKILENIEKAQNDDNIKGIFLNLTDISSNFGSMATIEEIRNKLIEFKKSEKFIVAHSNISYSQKAYYLASVADKIYLNPASMFIWAGMGGEMVFYKKALNKLGIEPQVIRHGKYKAAVEPFMLDKMSDENREQVMKYVGGLWNHMLKGISRQRNLSVEKLNELADNFKVHKAEDLVNAGLFDGALYTDQMQDELKKLTDRKETEKLNKIDLHKYSKVPKENFEFIKDKIAVIYATGEIGMKQSEDAIGPELANTIKKARENKNIKAVVLRVNSPGGSALVSDIIWREVVLTQKVKPVIASMGNVAASGGYYISCAADTIVASPNTITGSIGIFGLFFSGEDLIKNKLGLSTDAFGTNKHSNFGGGTPLPIPLTSRKFNKYEKEVLQSFIEDGYKSFVSKVSEGRHMTYEEIDKIGQGRVWTGEDAKEIGLVDVIGGLETAIRIAKEKAGLEKYTVVNLPKEKDPFEAIIESLTSEARTYMLERELGSEYKYYNKVKNIISSEGVQARIPYNLEIR